MFIHVCFNEMETKIKINCCCFFILNGVESALIKGLKKISHGFVGPI